MRRWNGWGEEGVEAPLPDRARDLLAQLVGPGTPTDDARLDDVVAAVPPSRLAADDGLDHRCPRPRPPRPRPEPAGLGRAAIRPARARPRMRSRDRRPRTRSGPCSPGRPRAGPGSSRTAARRASSVASRPARATPRS